MTNMLKFALNGELKKAEQIHYDYYKLFEGFRFETNPMAAKKAMELMNLPGKYLRKPLTELSEGKTNILRNLLTKRNVI